tara:strand:- start:121 stop:348 length:228 start_codon:yes stop_codon:yes gene_type:complete
MSFAHDRLQQLESELKVLERVKPSQPKGSLARNPTLFQWADYIRTLRAWQKRYDDLSDRIRQVRSLLEDDDDEDC